MLFLGIVFAYLLIALVIGSISAFQNQKLFRRFQVGPTLILLHIAATGMLWPLVLLSLRKKTRS